MSTTRPARRSPSEPTTRSITTSSPALNAPPASAALVNTSFNVHEEPIVNTPAECARALTDGRIDFVVTDKALYVRG